MNPSQIETWVEQLHAIQPRYEAFAERLQGLLGDLLTERELKYHLIEKRMKSVESFRQKITRADKKYTDPLAEVTDIAGLRIIVYNESDVEPVCDLIVEEFDVDQARSVDKLEGLQPAEFGYRSVHFVVSLAASRTGLAEWGQCAGLKGEIQVRSVFQHAWAVISHALQYRREEEVPAGLLRRLYRLSALVGLADQELSFLHAGQRDRILQVDKEFAVESPVSDIDRTSLIKYLSESRTVRDLTHVAKSYGIRAVWARGGRVLDPVVSELAWVCRQAGIKTTDELEALLADVVAKHLDYFRWLPSGWQMLAEILVLQAIVVARRERFIDIGPESYTLLNTMMGGFLDRLKRERTGKPGSETDTD